ncbi:MAG: tRNA (guanosine(46)-N7)-methyltransferase TrmB [Magnetococcales bacterium]|nr:tRNA (guanosine(46)-N7)-methyltransferase TrmB [Magnetococcales bacterium]MBF0584425.1 tRNA (guanosine(46)-N7)-methyltransferase TrmB [Magnetococcales bacterium]
MIPFDPALQAGPGEETAVTPHVNQPALIPRGRKQGKTGPQAKERLTQLLPTITLSKAIDRAELLTQWGTPSHTARLVLEIGFGNGHALATLAARHPQDCFIGVEVFLGGVAGLLLRIQQGGLTNIRVATQSIHTVLLEQIPPASLDQVMIHFPDPWPKRCHHKRRLIQAPFLDLLASRMRPSASLSLATDWPHYAEWMAAVLAKHVDFDHPAGSTPFVSQPVDWVETRFQRKAQEAGRTIHYLAAVRKLP